jgi:hypothetical protein
MKINHGRSVVAALLLGCVALVCSGCVGFSGPSDIRRAIDKTGHVDLEQDQAITVGPLGIMAAGMFAGPYLPVSLNGLSWVDWGQYTIQPAEGQTVDSLRLRELELPGWEPILRIREGGSDVAVLIGTNDSSVRKILFLQREGDQLQIVRAQGNLEKFIDGLLDSQLMRESSIDELLVGTIEDEEAVRLAGP